MTCNAEASLPIASNEVSMCREHPRSDARGLLGNGGIMATCSHGWGSDGMNPSGCPQCDALGRERDKAELEKLRAILSTKLSERASIVAWLRTRAPIFEGVALA